MNPTEFLPSNETLADACEFAAGMVKAQGAGPDKPACDLELHLNLAAKRLRETGPASGKCNPIVFDILSRLKQEHPEANVWARGHGFLDAKDTDGATPDIFQQPGMEGARMNVMEFTSNGFENRLAAIEHFLEIRNRDNFMEANTLDNRIVDSMNANAEALNRNLDVAIKAVEERLSARLADVEENILDLTRLVDRLTNSVDRQLNVLCGINEFQQDMESRLKVVEEFNDLIPRLDIQSHRAMEKLAALSAPLAAMESRLAAIESKLTR